MAKKPSKSPPSPSARATPPPPSTPTPPGDAAASTSPDTAAAPSTSDSGGLLLSMEALAHVEVAPTTAERAERLRTALGVRRYEANACVHVWADFLFGVLRFAIDDARLVERKARRLLTIAAELFEVAVTPSDAPDGRLPTLERVYDVFSERIRCASVGSSASGDDRGEDQGEDAADRFSVEEVARVVEFLSSTFFRHLRAYQRVASDRPARVSVTVLTPLEVETPLPPPPLADAILVQAK